MKESFLPSGDIYYRTNTWRKGRPTLVFIHGLSGSSSAWAEYEKKFEDRYNLLTFDLRGHGKSAKPKTYEEYNVERFAEDVSRLVDYLKLKKFFLISHSFGTLVALEFLAKHEAKVRAAILLSPHSAPGKRRAARIIRPLLSKQLMDYIPFSGKSGDHIDYSHYKNTGDWNVRRMIADIHNTSLRVFLYVTKQSYRFNKEHFLPHIKIPVLIIHGKNDSIFPLSGALFMAKHIKESTLVVLENTDHIVALNNVKEVTSAIETFVEAKKA